MLKLYKLTKGNTMENNKNSLVGLFGVIGYILHYIQDLLVKSIAVSAVIFIAICIMSYKGDFSLMFAQISYIGNGNALELLNSLFFISTIIVFGFKEIIEHIKE